MSANLLTKGGFCAIIFSGMKVQNAGVRTARHGISLRARLRAGIGKDKL